jgi:hypothetical protein
MANLPLHYGKVPPWLCGKMAILFLSIAKPMKKALKEREQISPYVVASKNGYSIFGTSLRQ